MDERALFSCDSDREHVRIGNIEEVWDPATDTMRALSSYMQRYNLADPPSDCCRRFIKHGGSSMPLLEWLATAYFSIAIHDNSAMKTELPSLLPASLLGFCRGLNAEDGTVGMVKASIRQGTQPKSALKAFMDSMASMLDICSGSVEGQVGEMWIKNTNIVRRYVCEMH